MELGKFEIEPQDGETAEGRFLRSVHAVDWLQPRSAPARQKFQSTKSGKVSSDDGRIDAPKT